MDRFSRGLMIVAMCLAVSVSVVTGLQCYMCQYRKANPSSGDVETALSDVHSTDKCIGSITSIMGSITNSMGSITNSMGNITNSTGGTNNTAVMITVEDCPPPGAGKKAMCGKVKVTADASVASTDVELTTVLRGCLEESSDTSDGCNQPDDTDKENLRRIYGRAATISSVEGDVCKCSSDLCNGQQKVTAEKLCWLAELFLVFCARRMW
ncbi:uncharacterized protein LOC135475264 [Liolophura sinensis]|uniref:uncharacterized protein LOC135475264 n=1 Tax=Liolophura sinensis TaxID=3198878 RepID=UPI003158CABF